MMIDLWRRILSKTPLMAIYIATKAIWLFKRPFWFYSWPYRNIGINCWKTTQSCRMDQQYFFFKCWWLRNALLRFHCFNYSLSTECAMSCVVFQRLCVDHCSGEWLSTLFSHLDNCHAIGTYGPSLISAIKVTVLLAVVKHEANSNQEITT